MPTRMDVVVEARSWLKTPYVHQHREKGVAVDCAGLVIGTARNVAIVEQDFDIDGYSPRPTGTSLLDECDKWMERVALQDLRIADVIVFHFGADPCHLGIVTPYLVNGLFAVVHAFADGRKRSGSVVEHRLVRTTTMTPLFGYALPGLSD